jgi:hypothetical protein
MTASPAGDAMAMTESTGSMPAHSAAVIPARGAHDYHYGASRVWPSMHSGLDAREAVAERLCLVGLIPD